MRVIGRGEVYRNTADPARQSCCFPCISVTPAGRWLCTIAAAPEKSRATRECLITWSDDCGVNWSEPIAPFRPMSAGGTPGDFRTARITPLGGARLLATLMWVDQTDPALPLFNDATEGILDSRMCLAYSEDDGGSWREPAFIDTTPFTMPLAITGPTLVLPDGRWAIQMELNKHYDDATSWRHCSVLMFSADGGRSWPEHVRVTDDPERRYFYWDQRPAVVQDGRLLDCFWTFDRQTALYLNIHACESRDGGRSWSALWDCGIPGQPAAPVPLADGRIALAYMDRTGTPLLKLRLSDDGGRTWPAATEQVLHEAQLPSQTWQKQSMQDAWAEMGKFSVGLPATALTPEGDLLIVYYAGTHTDQTGIEWIRLR